MGVTKLAIISDIHYYSPKLGVSGRAYELRSGGDQKCLAESGAVFDAAAEKIAASDVDAVLIAGDITNDGERYSHEEIFKKIEKLNEKKKVYLIVSTHDWCSDKNPRRFEGDKVFNDVEVLSREELTDMYGGFGRAKETASYQVEGGLVSRCFQLSENLRLLAIHDDCNGRGGKSGYDEEHLSWILEQIKQARIAGMQIIAMQHHLLLYGISEIINKGQSIADNFVAAGKMADAGLRLIFTGHSHMHRVTEFVSENGNKITQANIGSLCGYPAPISYAEVENSEIRLKTEFIDSFTYEGKEYGAEFFRAHTLDVLYNLLNAAAQDKKDLYERLNENGLKIKNYNMLYPFIRAAAKKTLKMRVGKAGRAVNFLSFGKGIDKAALKEIKDELLLTHVADIFLNVFDGSFTARRQKEAVKKIALDAARLPGGIVKRLPLKKKEKIFKITDEIKNIVQELLYPSQPDNLTVTIDLN